ncbi:cobalamin biosynthesis protein CbiL [Meridianimarinicoccus sp. RP-17]|uniref:cobalamin biosynthesis protein CbiL n=1 Tax=Meridianimarinicoccus zhengii TaxID=2056810 RepID=UPI000DACA588|nr:cobalamin biosynthesis protein CbiL [Phycocomes zhengii]
MRVHLLIVAALLVLLAPPALAHSLRVFVTAEGQMVRGYGFFVGGGRPDGAAWRAEAGDVTLATGTTDGEGAFGFVLPGPVPGDIVVTVDPGDGHAASATLAADRIGGAASPPVPAPGGGPTVHARPAAPMPNAAEIEAAVESAVARQVEPLLIRIEEMDARLRVTDLVSGGLAIFGLAGIALWLRGRSR